MKKDIKIQFGIWFFVAAIFWGIAVFIGLIAIGNQLSNAIIRSGLISEEVIEPNDDLRTYNFRLGKNGYSGWQMGCNYRLGSGLDQTYKDQRFLECANGIFYESREENKTPPSRGDSKI